MNMPILSEMENNISRLSLKEQLWLMERLVQGIRAKMSQSENRFEDELVMMANDPQIQEELQKINEEFAYADADGLDM
ncbi:MAG: hypothetical protein H6656_17710 [Ardenticatenaceae bacterium]|nr:hypothetical protein [Ardenticatenaceae bacterium]